MRASDPVLERLTALALLDAEQGFPRGPLFAEGLSLAAAAHLLGQGTPGSLAGRAAASAPLSPTQMRRLHEAIEASLPGRPRLGELAEAADHPAHRLGAAFRRGTGMGLWDYLAERRLVLAERLLADPALTLGAVAARAGYSSQAHLTTAFRRGRGITPAAWRALRRR